MQLNPQQVNDIFKRYTKYIEDETLKKRKGKDNPVTKTFWENYLNNLGGEVGPGQQEILKPKDIGRSSFCKPALNILHSLILSGKNPHDYYKELTKQNKNTNPNKGLVKDDYEFLLNMPNDWYSISIQDTREADKSLSCSEAESKIIEYILGISNRIVRHRLLMLFKVLKELDKKFIKEYGMPDKVIFEIAREDFIGENKNNEYQDFSKSNKKERIDSAAKWFIYKQ
jgi:CRISPR-associated endonuclease Csn1